MQFDVSYSFDSGVQVAFDEVDQRYITFSSLAKPLVPISV